MRSQKILPCRTRRGDFSCSFCLPPSLIGVKFSAAWTFCSRVAVCSQPMMTLATGWLKLNCKSSAGEARPAPLPTSMPWPMTFIDRMPRFFCSATGRRIFEGGDRFHFALGDGVGGLGGVERHQDRVEVMAAQRFGQGGAVVVAGDADEAGNFLCF